MERRTHWNIVLLAWTALFSLSALAEVVPFMDPGFFFDYNKFDEPVPITVTEQCETLHIKWSRTATQTGPNPVGPFFLHVFTSTFKTPFVIPAGNGPQFDWDMPFAPGTIYQICMFDNNGVTGGCQDKYTVIKNSTINTPTCQNITFPPLLGVEARDQTGPLSQHGFINQCSDISVHPMQNGTPPFTLLIAPSLHPPYKIVSNTRDPIIWTVSLSWSFPFFMSLTSSDGFMWAFGPEHSGGPGSDDCLAPGRIPSKKAHATAVGAGVGALFGGMAVGLLGAFFFWRFRLQDMESQIRLGSRPNTPGITPLPLDSSSPRDLPFLSGFRKGSLFPATGSAESPAAELPSNASQTVASPLEAARIGRTRTFVVHQDGGSVITSLDPPQGGGEIVDLPPRYAERNSTSPRPTRKV